MTVVALPPEQLEQLADLVAARLQRAPAAAPAPMEPLSCEQFGMAVGRSAEYVQDNCRTGGIRHLPGKPYRILREELARFRAEGPLTGAAKKRRVA